LSGDRANDIRHRWTRRAWAHSKRASHPRRSLSVDAGATTCRALARKEPGRGRELVGRPHRYRDLLGDVASVALRERTGAEGKDELTKYSEVGTWLGDEHVLSFRPQYEGRAGGKVQKIRK
jgi:hypothetical protein